MSGRVVRGALLLLALSASVSAQPPEPPEPQDHPTDLVNALLGGLLGLTEVSPEVLQAEVAEVGGIPFRSPVPLDYITPGDVPDYLREVIDDEYPPARAEADERVLVAFDLLAPGAGLRAIRTRVLEENVAGFYDERPGRKRLFAVSRERRLTPANQVVLAHELRHAQQDQYADLHGTVPEAIGDFDDRRLAFLCLLEGDATLVMERFLARRVGLAAGEGGLGGSALPVGLLPEAPPVVLDQLLVPYVAGRDFADALVRAGGWEAVRRAWTDPPASTEQVLHPEKYLRREAPRPVTVRWAPAGARVVGEGVLGEALTRTLLGEGGGRDRAAAGWGGDAFRVWDVGGRTLLVWKTEWDDAGEAAEFHRALRARLAATHGTPRETATAVEFERRPWRAALRVDGTSVTLVRSDDPSAFIAAMAARP